MAKQKAAAKQKNMTVGIIGMGYVGLPLARAFCANGVKVLGFDINEERVANLNKGLTPIKSVTSAELREMIAGGLFRATAAMRELSKPDAILICVPTPLTENREPDMTYVEATCRTIAKYLRKDQLVVLESLSLIHI